MFKQRLLDNIDVFNTEYTTLLVLNKVPASYIIELVKVAFPDLVGLDLATEYGEAVGTIKV